MLRMPSLPRSTDSDLHIHIIFTIRLARNLNTMKLDLTRNSKHKKSDSRVKNLKTFPSSSCYTDFSKPMTSQKRFFSRISRLSSAELLSSLVPVFKRTSNCGSGRVRSRIPNDTQPLLSPRSSFSPGNQL